MQQQSVYRFWRTQTFLHAHLYWYSGTGVLLISNKCIFMSVEGLIGISILPSMWTLKSVTKKIKTRILVRLGYVTCINNVFTDCTNLFLQNPYNFTMSAQNFTRIEWYRYLGTTTRTQQKRLVIARLVVYLLGGCKYEMYNLTTCIYIHPVNLQSKISYS